MEIKIDETMNGIEFTELESSADHHTQNKTGQPFPFVGIIFLIVLFIIIFKKS